MFFKKIGLVVYILDTHLRLSYYPSAKSGSVFGVLNILVSNADPAPGCDSEYRFTGICTLKIAIDVAVNIRAV